MDFVETALELALIGSFQLLLVALLVTHIARTVMTHRAVERAYRLRLQAWHARATRSEAS